MLEASNFVTEKVDKKYYSYHKHYGQEMEEGEVGKLNLLALAEKINKKVLHSVLHHNSIQRVIIYERRCVLPRLTDKLYPSAQSPRAKAPFA